MIDIEKCRITHYPAEVLASRAKPIEKIDDNIRRLVERMTDIMLENKGIGLAAPQAGVSLRSVPGIFTKIRRYKKCKVTATGLDGSKFTEEAEGLYARALQHEYDHIEGMTIVNRMGQAAKIVHRRQLKALQKAK